MITDSKARRHTKRFFRYTASSSVTFAIDLLLLFILTDLLLWNYLFAAGCSFLIAITLNYFLSRRFAFAESTRSMHLGYLFFFGIALVGLFIIEIGMYVMVAQAHFNYLIARIAIALIAGLWNFLMNSFVNFR